MVSYEDDCWEISCSNTSVGNKYLLHFEYWKSKSLKRQVKDCIYSNLKRDYLSHATLYLYTYFLRHFQKFMDVTNQPINYFSELSALMVEQFAMYLKSNIKSVRTMGSIYLALKAVVRHGQLLQSDNYPENEIFSPNYTRLFGIEFGLKTKGISDFILMQITEAIKKEKNLLLKAVIAIAKGTGLRLSEILLLEQGCVMYDFYNLPILFTFSLKNNEERAVPITAELAEIIHELQEYTRRWREIKKTEQIFILPNKTQPHKIEQYYQGAARDELKQFILENRIVDESGNPAKFTFHSFRHSLGTSLLSSGLSPFEVKRHLGHHTLRSTQIYAKVLESTVQKEYERLGLIGISEEALRTVVSEPDAILKKHQATVGELPNGFCMKAFDGDKRCEKFNICLFCSKYRTFVKDLPTHKDHLLRVRIAIKQYDSSAAGESMEYMKKLEAALETIIRKLEEML